MKGLVVKALNQNATYEPAKRSLNWLKCKKDYLDSIGDTLDLVVMGALCGTGKRGSLFGCYLLGCYDQNTNMYQSVCKVGTGFTHVNLEEFTQSMHKHKTRYNAKPKNYNTRMNMDVWFKPNTVWEIKGADITMSSIHMGGVGIVHESKGCGLRFPRFLRVRDDKKPKQATTTTQVVEMYYTQAKIR